MHKILTALSNFFKAIWRWFLDNAWIQVLLIVGLIFGIIFSIKPIADGINYLIARNKESKYYSTHEVVYNDIIKKTEENTEKDFTIIFMQETCSHCHELEKPLEKFNNTYPDLKIYSIDIGVKTFTEDNLAHSVEKIKQVYDELAQDDKNSEYPSFPDDSIPTPTLVRYKDGVISNVTLGIDITDATREFLKFIKD